MSEKMRAALEKIAAWKKYSFVNADQLSDYETGANDAIDTLAGIAREALSAPPEGREQGIEEAANVVERLGKASLTFTNHAAAEAAKAIRALASPQEETDV